MHLTIYTETGSVTHDKLIDAFLLHRGWVPIDGAFFEVLTMSPEAWGPGRTRTRWLLRAATAGAA